MSGNGYSLSDRVFNTLRDDILSGKYMVNEDLKEMVLASRLGVSRTPIREALRQLELEGLIEIVPNKGATVIGIDQDDIRDIFTMRSMLEGLCAAKAVHNVTEEILAEMEEVVDLSEYHVNKGKYEHVLELDNRFHKLLYEASGSKMLKKTLSDFHQYLKKVRKETLSAPERAGNSNVEHRKILNALKEKNDKEAEKLANLHIRNTIKNMEEHGLWL